MTAVDAAGVHVPGGQQNDLVASFSRATLRALPPERGPVLVEAFGGFRAQGVGAGVAFELERHGVPVVVLPIAALAFGPGREEEPGEPLRARVLVTTDEGFAKLADRDTWQLIARQPHPAAADPLSRLGMYLATD